MLIFSVAGIPLVVASVFSRVIGGVVLGLILLLMDLALVPRKEYRFPLEAFLKASVRERALVIAATILFLSVSGRLILGTFLPGNGTYGLSLFFSYVLFALWFALRLALRL